MPLTAFVVAGVTELEDSLAGRWSVFNPSRMFPFKDGDKDLLAAKRRAFRWWTEWLFEVCGRGPGQTLVKNCLSTSGL